MSYLVLARKARPQTFKEVVGQKAVVRTLQNALEQNRVSHALIFSGVRGVGKTTLARIMAKALNCIEEHTTEPCNACVSCREINAGSSVDLVEIDGASNRGIQEIRELKENIRFMPTGSRYKIIIIDEVHMLTAEAFNALLKTLEEPPGHVYFMFATTELHRVPVTILSRCQRYELKRVGTGELTSHFQSIADKEKIEIEPAALNIIVREAGGSVRDGLSLLDQVFAYCGSTVKAEDIVDILGLVSHQVIAELSGALLAGDISGTLQILDRTYAFGMDLKRFVNDLLARFRALVVCSVSAKPEQLLDLPDNDLAELTACARKYSPQTLILMFNVLMENLEKTGYSSRPRYALEMALMKALQAGEVVPVTEILGRLDELLAKDASDITAAGGGHAPAEKKTPLPQENDGSQPASSPETVNRNSIASGQGAGSADSKPRHETKERGGDTVLNPPPNGHEACNEQGIIERRTADPAPEPVNRTVRQHWNEFIAYVKERKLWMASALQMAKSARLREGELVIEYETSVHCSLLRNRENITLLTQFALDFFQEDFRITFNVPDSGGCEVDPANGNKVKQERKALANDSLVLTAVDIFNGEVGAIRIGPRFRGPIEEEGSAVDQTDPDDC
ncbi:MAG: DNA polymerase III subunit gamma/tau [Desulfobulbaceae bacterium]|nr:DNA polymerase III subunit gamma/tau [Desulfobulbaceae bacterium]